MDHWGEIERLIKARRAEPLVQKIKGLDGAGRKDVAARLPELVKELRKRSDRWNDRLAPYGPALRVAGAGTIGGAAAVASWVNRSEFTAWLGASNDDTDLILAVIADRPDAWRADLTTRLVLRLRTADDPGLPLALALLRATGAQPPAHDPLVVGWVSLPLWAGRPSVSPSGLSADPLLDHLLPRLFEAQGVGRALQWEADPGDGWLGTLVALAEAGRVKRDALIDGCVRRFLLGGTAPELRFFVRLHEALDPASEEVASRARDYLRLLPHAPGPVAESAVKRLRACAGLDADDLAEAWDALLFRPERKLVRAGLSWLDKSVRRTPELTAVIAAPLARAFAADADELQEKAVDLAVAHADAMGEEGRAVVREAIALLPARLGSRAAAAFGGGEVAEAGPEFVPRPLHDPPERAVALAPAIDSAAEIAELIMQGPSPWERWERLLAGFVTLAVRDRAHLVAALRSRTGADGRLGTWDHAQDTWETADQWLRGAADTLIGSPHTRKAWRRRMPRVDLAPPHLLLLHRVAEILRAVEEDTLPPLLLATPTHSTGHVAALELVRRMEVIEAAGAKPLAADLQQALLRLPRDPDPEAARRAERLTSPAGRVLAGWTCPEVEVELAYTCFGVDGDHDWRDRSHYHDVRVVPRATATPTGLPLVDLMLGVPRHMGDIRHLEMWHSMVPSHREVAAAYVVPYTCRRYAESRGLEQARHLARAEGPGGAAFAAVLARELGNPRTPETVDVLLEVAARDELPAAEVGRQTGMLVVSDAVKIIDVVRALDDAARRGGHEHVWRIAAAALPMLLPAPGERPRQGLRELVALACTVAEWSGARGAIPEVRDMAARKGNSALLREVRRLHDLLGDGAARQD